MENNIIGLVDIIINGKLKLIDKFESKRTEQMVTIIYWQICNKLQ